MTAKQEIQQRNEAVEIPVGGSLPVLELKNGEYAPWEEAIDFKLIDRWSRHFRESLRRIRKKGGFRGDFFEAGIGDGRNVLAAGVHEGDGKIRGVELEGWRLYLTRHNLGTTLEIPESRLELHEGDVVEYLDNLQGERLTGWGVACLPQAPGIETSNTADGYNPDMLSLQNVRDMKLNGHPIDELGLTLNAAFLKALRQKVDANDFNLALTLSGRVPRTLHEELFTQTGWKIVEAYPTEEPIQQDPDTGVDYVKAFDDGRRFYAMNSDDSYREIPAVEAERRRIAGLDVYHHLLVYHVRPAAQEVTVYENN